VEIIVHQLLCGENEKKAWDLLKSTMPKDSIARNIAFKADLQDQTPTGLIWQPILRGFVYNEYFLLIKTYPDNSKEVRHGRVFSHVLVVDKEEIKGIENINILLTYFSPILDKSISIQSFKVEPSVIKPFQIELSLAPRFNKLIHGYTELHNYKNTIVWVGQEDYEDAVCGLWQLLSEKDKEVVSFGINFNSSQINEDKTNFITIPESLESKFLYNGYFVIRKNDTYSLSNFYERYLSGNSDAVKQVAFFKATVEAENLNRSAIENISKVWTTFQDLDTTTDIKRVNTLSHIVAAYSPNEDKGKAFKSSLLNKLVSLLPHADVQEIQLFKTFKIKSFAGSEAVLAVVIEDWLKANLFSLEVNTKLDFTSLINSVYASNSTKNWWSALIKKNIEKFLCNANHNSISIFLIWIKRSFDIFNYLNSAIEKSKKAEDLMISLFPSDFGTNSFKWLKSFAVEREWLKFHAKVICLEYPFKKAIKEQLKIDFNPNYFAGLDLITKGKAESEIVDASLENDDSRLIQISSKLCISNPSLLEGIDIQNINCQRIWLEVIKSNKSLIFGIKDVQQVINSLLDLLISENLVDEGLLEQISNTNFGNVLNYTQKSLLWPKLPNRLRDSFLNKTSAALLEELSINPDFDIPSDKTLLDYLINSNAVTNFLYYNRNNIKSIIPLFKAVSQLPENLLRDYINNYNGKIDVIDSTQLGRIVYQRKFITVANAIYNKSYVDSNFKYALMECSVFLDFFTNAKAFLSGTVLNKNITSEQWLDAFKEIAYKLYPTPMHNKIWVQAGGEEYDLMTGVTGKEMWISAINRLAKGGYHEITIKSLVKQMLKENPKNEKLQVLKDLLNRL
jgi:hypothetical protein